MSDIPTPASLFLAWFRGPRLGGIARRLHRLASAWSSAAMILLIMGCATQAQETFSTSTLSIASGTKTHEFKVELAISVRQRIQGLMWRKRLPPDSGMLFIYPGNQVIEMWMKNTLIPLDMLFIDKTGKIVRIRERAVPQSVKVISSGQKVKGVLELAGGTVSKLGLKTGDRILHPAFGTQ